ncbi:cytochrome b-c1 complex subunit 10 [Lates japonicus]|uniref:Cytochrome b-c1 complex subunit 10 n=1 Tax=Lates japonicus TaxID=270547 RepID=A0AAD3MQR0_LATJO|nr:cytochrome b-c1 complex subunit 10 [Lates japonicus]
MLSKVIGQKYMSIAKSWIPTLTVWGAAGAANSRRTSSGTRVGAVFYKEQELLQPVPHTVVHLNARQAEACHLHPTAQASIELFATNIHLKCSRVRHFNFPPPVKLQMEGR